MNNSSNLNYISTSERIRSSISSFSNIQTLSPINSFAFSAEVGELSREFLTFCSRFFSSVDRFFSLPVAQAEDDNFYFKNAAKEVGHVLGDNYVKETDLEGWQSEQAKHIALKAAQNLSPKLQERISNIANKIQYIPLHFDASKLSQEIAQKIFDLKDNESFWLEGGWSSEGGSGHAMLYEFVKRKDSTSSQGFVIDAYIYNTGSGLEYHYSELRNRDEESSLISDTKLAEVSSSQQYVCPFVKFEGIEPEEIGLFKNSIEGSFFQNLIEAIKLTDESKAAAKIYIEAFAPLNHRRMADPRTSEDFFLILPQYSGTCAWRVLVYAALKKHLGKDAELAEVEIKRDNFLKNCVRKDLPPDLNEVCFQGGKEILLDLAALPEVILSQETRENYRETIQTKLDVLQKNKELLSLPITDQPHIPYKEEKKLLNIKTKNIPINLEQATKPSKDLVVFPADPPNLSSISALKTELYRINSFAGKDQPYDVSMQIERLVHALPRPALWKDSWPEAKEDEIRECISAFTKVSNLYAEKVLGGNVRLLTEQNAVWALFGVIHHLSSRLDPRLIDTYGMYLEPFKNLPNNPYFTNFRPQDIEFYRELLSYFENLPAKKIFDPQKINELDLNAGVAPEKIEQELFYWDGLEENEALKKALLTSYDDFKKKENYLVSLGEKSFSRLAKDRQLRAHLLKDLEIFRKVSTFAYKADLTEAAYTALAFASKKHYFRSHHVSYEKNEDEKRWPYFQLSIGLSDRFPETPREESDFNQGNIISANCLFKADNESKFEENQGIESPILEIGGFAFTRQTSPFLMKIDSATCQKSLQSQLLIDRFSENIGALSNVQKQNLFLISLFRSSASSTPLHEAIKNPDFLDSVKEFVDKGIRLFSKTKKKPDIKTILFFIQVARRFKELGAPLFLKDEMLQKINDLMNRKDLEEPDKNALHMHRILEYTTQKETLNQLSSSQTDTSKALREIIVSWMHLSAIRFHSWQYHHSQSEAAHFIYDLAPAFSKLSSSFFQELIRDMIPGMRESLTITKQDNGLYHLKDSSQGSWTIHPIQAKIFYNGDPLSLGVVKDFTQTTPYQHLFGQKKFFISKQGNAFVFEDDHGNAYRILENNSQGVVIQRFFEGDWYQYISGDKDLSQEELNNFLKNTPKSLIADHYIFRSKDKTLFVQRDNLRVDWMDVDRNPRKEYSMMTGGDDFYSSITPFEQKSWILEKGQENGQVEIHFPRYLSLDENPLIFTKTAQGISWNGNPQFFLKKAPSNAPILGLCPHYLFLQKDNKSKVLVPCKQVRSSKNAAPHCDLDIQDERKSSVYSQNTHSPIYTGELNTPQKGVYKFLEYDVENGQPKPLNSEGALFLSYLFLVQKDYQKALDLFKGNLSLKAHLVLSEESVQMLEWIVEHAVSSYDQSPPSVALALRASLILLKDRNSPSGNLKHFQKVDEILPLLVRAYQDRLQVIPANLRLSKTELEELKSLFPSFSGGSISAADWQKKSSRSLSQDIKSIARRMVFDPTDMAEFKKVYNAFLSAKTEQERTFLKAKYAKFLWSNDLQYPLAIKAAMEGNGSYLEYPTLSVDLDIGNRKAEILEAKQWLQQFGDPDKTVDLVIAHDSSLNSSKKKLQAPFVQQTLLETLHKAKSPIPPSSFELPQIILESGNLLDTYPSIKKFLVQEPFSSRKNRIPENLISRKTAKPSYSSVIEQERADFIHEYEQGRIKNEQEPRYILQAGKNVGNLHQELNIELQKHLEKIQKLEIDLETLANRLPNNQIQKTLNLLLQGGGVLSKAKIPDLVNCFLEGSSQSYLNVNSHLREADIQQIDAMILQLLILHIESTQMKKALQIDDPHEIGLIVFAPTAYAEKGFEESLLRQFLVFEYRAGIKIRPEQISLIVNMAQKKACVTQLMMGGGKTSVIASNLLYLTAKPGRIAFFIPPAAQFSTLRENLGNTQKQYFNQEVIPVQLRREQLTENNLKWLKKQMHAAKTSRKIILTTRETIESLNLEYLSMLHSGDPNSKKLHLLSFLVKEIKTVGDVLVDEVDLILNPMQETNFPTGAKIPISPVLIHMSRQLFQLLASQTALRLSKNEQSVLTESEHEEILQKVLEIFFDSYKELDLDPIEKKSFLQFASGKTTDRSFKAILKTRSQNEKLISSAEKLSLLKHLFRDVLPLTLSKNTGEHYGRVLDDVSVGPYQGVASPSFTEFGSPWEALSYHFQTVASKGVLISQVKEFCDGIYASAVQEAEISGIDLEDTWEARSFYNHIGFSITDLEKVETLEKVALKINETPELQFLLEANTIAQLVGFYINYLRSTSQNFVENFSGFDSFSGTPWNPESFPQFLQDHFSPDVGTEGKIIDIFLERAEQNPNIHLADSIDPKKTLAATLANMSRERKQRLFGFIDSAGFFKDSDGLSVAKDILEFYAKEQRIQSVLFFGRKTPRSPMILMALKKGSDTPICIGSTQKEEIAKHGIFPESTFVYYDQTHCEATDILQKEDAINIISVNHKSIRRALTQGILRLRAYFKGQDVEVLIPKQELSHFTEKNEVTHLDVLLKALDNQAIRKADQTFRSYKQKIDQALRQVVMDLLLQEYDPKKEVDIFKRFKSILLTTRSQDLYQQFGKPEILVNTLEDLQKYRAQQETFFKSLTEDAAIHGDVSMRLDKIMESASSCRYLPTQVVQTASDHLGVEIEVAQEVAQEVNVEVEVNQEVKVEVQVDREIDLSLQTDLAMRTFKTVAKEMQWSDEKIDQGRNLYLQAAQYKDEESATRLYSMKDLWKGSYQKSRQAYDQLFTSDLLISHSFCRTYATWDDCNLFTKNGKEKYAGEVLFFKQNGVLKASIISTLEARFFQDYIQRKSPKDLWLVSSSGKSLVANSVLEKTEEAKDLLWQVELFNGNVKALLADTSMFKKKMAALDRTLLSNFLEWKIRLLPEHRNLFDKYFSKSNPSGQASASKKDSFQFFRSFLSFPASEELKLSDYKALQDLGVSETFLLKCGLDIRELLLKHVNVCKKLQAAGVTISQILSLPFADMVQILEKADKILGILKNGIKWETLLWEFGIEPIHREGM